MNGKEYYAEIQKKNVYGNQVRYIYCFDGNVLKYRVVEGLYYTTDMKPIKNIITYNSISTKVMKISSIFPSIPSLKINRKER